MRVANIYTNANPPFLGIISFYAAREGYNKCRHEILNNSEGAAKTAASEDVIALYDEAGKIIKNAKPALDRFEDIQNYATRKIAEVNDSYLKFCISNNRDFSRGILKEKDDNGTLKTEAKFDRDGNLEIIKDYANNRIIHFRNLPSLELKSECSYNAYPVEEFTVFLDCENIEDKNTIKAKESFSYSSGSLRRYTGSCSSDIEYDRFYSDFAYTFKRSILTGFDSKYTVAAGTEYSNSCFLFDCKHYDYNYNAALLKAVPSKYFENKVFYNGAIRHSIKELRFSDYKFPPGYFE